MKRQIRDTAESPRAGLEVMRSSRGRMLEQPCQAAGTLRGWALGPGTEPRLEPGAWQGALGLEWGWLSHRAALSIPQVCPSFLLPAENVAFP